MKDQILKDINYPSFNKPGLHAFNMLHVHTFPHPCNKHTQISVLSLDGKFSVMGAAGVELHHCLRKVNSIIR